MNETKNFKQWLEERGNCVTLGEIMQTHFGCEYRKHFTLLRREGINFKVTLNRKEPSKNLYTLKNEVLPSVRFDEVGQAVMFL